MTAPTNELTRQGFLRIGIGFLGAITLPLGLGCPADDGDDEGAGSTGTPSDDSTTAADGESTTAAAGCTMDPSVTISANHGHVLTVTLADVMGDAEVTYGIQGTSAHAHDVTLTADHFAMIEQGMQVTVDSTLGEGHTHQVTVVCG
jgi:hypothetical protein